MVPNLKFLSFVYRLGLAFQKIFAALAWFFGGLFKIVRYLVCDIFVPNWKQFLGAIAAFSAFMAFLLFVVQPVQEWIEDRAMMKNPIIANVGDEILVDGKKVIRFNEEGRFHMYEITGGGLSIEYLKSNDQSGDVFVCANSAFQSECNRLSPGQGFELVDYDSPERGPLGSVMFVKDEKSGDAYILIKTYRELQTLPEEYRDHR